MRQLTRTGGIMRARTQYAVLTVTLAAVFAGAVVAAVPANAKPKPRPSSAAAADQPPKKPYVPKPPKKPRPGTAAGEGYHKWPWELPTYVWKSTIELDENGQPVDVMRLIILPPPPAPVIVP